MRHIGFPLWHGSCLRLASSRSALTQRSRVELDVDLKELGRGPTSTMEVDVDRRPEGSKRDVDVRSRTLDTSEDTSFKGKPL